jgi:hypothetical protein
MGRRGLAEQGGRAAPGDVGLGCVNLSAFAGDRLSRIRHRGPHISIVAPELCQRPLGGCLGRVLTVSDAEHAGFVLLRGRSGHFVSPLSPLCIVTGLGPSPPDTRWRGCISGPGGPGG